MRVLHLLGQDQDIGGVLSVIRNLQQATAGTNWTHVVWVNEAYRETRRPTLDYRVARHAWGDSPSHTRLLLQALRALPELKGLLSRESFDVLHAHTRGMLLVALMTARRTGRSAIFTNHNFARRTGFYRWAARQPRIHTVLLTPNMAGHYGLNKSQTRARVISACCADDFFQRDLSSNSRRSSGRTPLRLVGVGNVVDWKKWHLIVEAFRQLTAHERARLEFVHWGPVPADPDSERYDRKLREIILRHGLKDRFVLRGPTLSVSNCLCDADWFVLPSTNEPCSVALIEALALGIPALVSASGGNVDIVRDGRTGLLFQPDSPDDLAVKLRKILDGACDLLSPEKIRESVRERSASAVAAQYGKLYRDVMDESARHECRF